MASARLQVLLAIGCTLQLAADPHYCSTLMTESARSAVFVRRTSNEPEEVSALFKQNRENSVFQQQRQQQPEQPQHHQQQPLTASQQRQPQLQLELQQPEELQWLQPQQHQKQHSQDPPSDSQLHEQAQIATKRSQTVSSRRPVAYEAPHSVKLALQQSSLAPDASLKQQRLLRLQEHQLQQQELQQRRQLPLVSLLSPTSLATAEGHVGGGVIGGSGGALLRPVDPLEPDALLKFVVAELERSKRAVGTLTPCEGIEVAHIVSRPRAVENGVRHVIELLLKPVHIVTDRCNNSNADKTVIPSTLEQCHLEVWEGSEVAGEMRPMALLKSLCKVQKDRK